MPDFTVIVPTYNRPEQLSQCLASLLRIEFEGSYEVCVVDDGSSANYESVKESFPQVKWLEQANSGPGAARNLAAQNARGRRLAFLDDDCLAEPDWLSNLSDAFDRYPDAVLGGTTEAADPSNPYDATSQLVQHIAYAHFNKDEKNAVFFASNNLAVTTDFFLNSGGFSPVFARTASEDREWCNRASYMGQRLIWAKEARVLHKPGLDFSGFCKMFFRYGRGAALYHSHRKVGTLTQDSNFYIEFPSLLQAQFRKRPELSRPRTIGLLLIWQLCNTAGFLYQSAEMDNSGPKWLNSDRPW